jgi:hypothetical protein
MKDWMLKKKKRDWMVSLRWGMRQGCLASLLPFNNELEILAHAIR